MTTDSLYVILGDIKHSIRKPTLGSVVVLMCSSHLWGMQTQHLLKTEH
jgi:hypothetical protein